MRIFLSCQILIKTSSFQNIAELYETECVDLSRAMQHYEQAADYFRGEESTSSANKCMLKLAQYAAQLEHYDKAIQIYEQVWRINFCSRCIRSAFYGTLFLIYFASKKIFLSSYLS